MAFLTIKFDENQLAKVRALLRKTPGAISGIVSRGINRTLVTTRKKAIDRLKDKIKLPSETMKRRIRIYRATRKNWRGKVWIGGAGTALSKFDARQSRKTRLVETAPRQSVWLYYNIFRRKYGRDAKFAWSYHIKKQEAKVTYNLGQGRKTLQEAFIVKFKSGHKAVLMGKRFEPFSPLYKSRTGEIFVNNMRLLQQAEKTVTGLQDYAQRLLVKNINDQVRLVLAGKIAS